MLASLVLALLSGLHPAAASTPAGPDDQLCAYAYTPAGALARVELPVDGVDVREYAYDAFGRPSEELRKRDAAVVRRTTTVWSGLGATRTVHDVVGGDPLLRTVLEGGGPAEVEPGAAPGGDDDAGNPAIEQVERFRHEYDAAGRLDAVRRDVWAAGAWVEDSPGLDADDNPLPRLDVAFDPLGRMRTWVEDGQTRTFTWDAESRMVQATLGAGAPGGGETWNYAYNWRDQRTAREGGALGAEWAYAYRWGADGLLTEQVTAPGGAVTDRAFVQRAGLTLGVVSGAGVTAFGHDHLGSPVVTRAPGGAVDTRRFGAWGALASGDAPAHGEVQVGYTGHGFDPESGLVYAQARYHATGLGVFLSEDPYEGSLGEPLSLGRWGYVHGNPVVWVDPDGRRVEWIADAAPDQATTAHWRMERERQAERERKRAEEIAARSQAFDSQHRQDVVTQCGTGGHAETCVSDVQEAYVLHGLEDGDVHQRALDTGNYWRGLSDAGNVGAGGARQLRDEGYFEAAATVGRGAHFLAELGVGLVGGFATAAATQMADTTALVLADDKNGDVGAAVQQGLSDSKWMWVGAALGPLARAGLKLGVGGKAPEAVVLRSGGSFPSTGVERSTNWRSAPGSTTAGSGPSNGEGIPSTNATLGAGRLPRWMLAG